jgi:hypothetical protein
MAGALITALGCSKVALDRSVESDAASGSGGRDGSVMADGATQTDAAPAGDASADAETGITDGGDTAADTACGRCIVEPWESDLGGSKGLVIDGADGVVQVWTENDANGESDTKYLSVFNTEGERVRDVSVGGYGSAPFAWRLWGAAGSATVTAVFAKRWYKAPWPDVVYVDGISGNYRFETPHPPLIGLSPPGFPNHLSITAAGDIAVAYTPAVACNIMVYSESGEVRDDVLLPGPLHDFAATGTGGLAILYEDRELGSQPVTYSVLLYDSALKLVNEWQPPAGVTLNAITSDGEESIVVAGHRLDSTRTTPWLQKLDLPALTPAWPAPVGGEDGSTLLGVDVGAQGQIAVAGARPGTVAVDNRFIELFEPSGTRIWDSAAVFGAEGVSPDHLHADVEIQSDGDILLTSSLSEDAIGRTLRICRCGSAGR